MSSAGARAAGAALRVSAGVTAAALQRASRSDAQQQLHEAISGSVHARGKAGGSLSLDGVQRLHSVFGAGDAAALPAGGQLAPDEEPVPSSPALSPLRSLLHKSTSAAATLASRLSRTPSPGMLSGSGGSLSAHASLGGRGAAAADAAAALGELRAQQLPQVDGDVALAVSSSFPSASAEAAAAAGAEASAAEAAAAAADAQEAARLRQQQERRLHEAVLANLHEVLLTRPAAAMRPPELPSATGMAEPTGIHRTSLPVQYQRGGGPAATSTEKKNTR